MRLDAGAGILRVMYGSRQIKRFAGRKIAVTIDGPRSLAPLAGISRERRAYTEESLLANESGSTRVSAPEQRL